MARYFFDLLECGTLTRDEEGQVLTDQPAARDHAITTAREIMCAELATGKLCLSCKIEIFDGSRTLIETVGFGEAVVVTGR